MFYIEEFLNHLQENRYSSKTIKDYSYLLHNFESYFQNNHMVEPKRISESEIFEYLNKIRNRKNSVKEYASKISRLKKYFQFLEINGLIFLSPLKYHPVIKFQKKSFPVLDKKEMENLLENVKTDRPLCIKGKAIIELAYSSALRSREIYNLKIIDIDFKKELIFIEQSKNQKDRIVPVGKTALLWIKKYIKEVRSIYIKEKNHNYVFISHKTGEKLTVWGIRWAVQETLRLSGLQSIKPYSIRSTAATALLLNGMSIAYISKLLGHSDIRTTQLYLKVKTVELKNELDRKHPRLNFEKQLQNTKEVEQNEV